MESADIIANENNESTTTVRRYIRPTYLIHELLDEFDEKTPSLSQAIRMKKQEGNLDEDMIKSIMMKNYILFLEELTYCSIKKGMI